MRGELVVLKDVNGFAIVRRVWDCSAKGVYILEENQWKLRISGEKSLEPVGFPFCDVYVYDDAAVAQLALPCVKWEMLTPFRAADRIAA